MSDTFAPPPGSQWVGVSSRLRTMRRTIVTALGLPVVGIVGGVLLDREPVAGVAVFVVGALFIVWVWTAVGRNWRSWGYTERADDLIVIHGAMFKRMVVVPYGRMQLVDVEAGPVERAFGVVTVKLHTAAATTDARVRGLTPPDAAALRDRLTALGETHAAGL